jgi:hypothetical protein
MSSSRSAHRRRAGSWRIAAREGSRSSGSIRQLGAPETYEAGCERRRSYNMRRVNNLTGKTIAQLDTRFRRFKRFRVLETA